jgi:hypothetical protein
MRLYLAGAETTGIWVGEQLLGIDNLAFLSSYFYIAKSNYVAFCYDNKIPHMLDSGAFSAMHSGAQIDIDAYCDFIKEHGAKFEKVAALDCIGDWRGSEKNLQYMRSKGVNPIPVFHTNEPFDYLDNLLRENDFLCLGVTGSKLRQPQIIAWLVEVFKRRAAINPGCKMHGFALTSAKIIKYFDWDSCDSTTYLNGMKFGEIFELIGNNVIKLKAQRAKAIYPDYDYKMRVIHNARTMLMFANQKRTAVEATCLKK